jgi:hypothetical protein
MRGRDWQSERLRYVVYFSDGGAGTRYVDEQLEGRRRDHRRQPSLNDGEVSL